MSKVWMRGLRAWTAAIVALALPSAAGAAVIIVNDGESIQAAVDAAVPGDVIRVRSGTYSGGITIGKSDITLIGAPDAVIDATGFHDGIRVGGPFPSTCPAAIVTNFTIRGFTIRNADDTGVRLVGVDGFNMTQGTYLDNAEYGPFPVCSSNGVVSHNLASGHADAAIYVGDSVGVEVRNNVVVDSAIGIEIENSIDSEVHNNVTSGNVAGILVVVLPGLPIPETTNVSIHHNAVTDNNLSPNPGGGFVALLPVGSGILNVGGDGVVTEFNTITGNDSFGIATIANPFADLDPRIEPFTDDNVTRFNDITGNGGNPDPVNALTPGADIVFLPFVVDLQTGDIVAVDPDPSDNCYENNVFDVDFPPGIVSLFPCD